MFKPNTHSRQVQKQGNNKAKFNPTKTFCLKKQKLKQDLVSRWASKHNETQESKLYRIKEVKNGQIAQEHSRTMDEHSFHFTIAFSVSKQDGC